MVEIIGILNLINAYDLLFYCAKRKTKFLMLIVRKIFVKVRLHLSDCHTKMHKIYFCKINLIHNITKLYAKDVF